MVSPSESRDSLFEKIAPALREGIGCAYIDIKLVDEAGTRVTSVADMVPGQQLVVKTLSKMVSRQMRIMPQLTDVTSLPLLTLFTFLVCVLGEHMFADTTWFWV